MKELVEAAAARRLKERHASGAAMSPVAPFS